MTSSEPFWFFNKGQVNQMGIMMFYISAFTTLLSIWLSKAIVALIIQNLRQLFSRNYGLKPQGKQRLNQCLWKSCNLTIFSFLGTLDKSHHCKSCFCYLISCTFGGFTFLKRNTSFLMQVSRKRVLFGAIAINQAENTYAILTLYNFHFPKQNE